MNDKQILDRLESINLSLRQKRDLIDVIKDIAGNNASNDNTSKEYIVITVNRVTSEIIIDNKRFPYKNIDNNEIKIEVKNEELFKLLYSRLYRKIIVAHISMIFDEVTSHSIDLLASLFMVDDYNYEEHYISFDFIYQSRSGYIRITK